MATPLQLCPVRRRPQSKTQPLAHDTKKTSQIIIIAFTEQDNKNRAVELERYFVSTVRVEVYEREAAEPEVTARLSGAADGEIN